MFLIALAFICALAISSVAIYYSVIGLAAIFAAAKVPIYIMGGVLEVAKLVTASWLYQNWKNIPFLLKAYLTTAVGVLMIITSLGIFGFLSKAHIEQATPAAETVAKIDRINEQIIRQETTISNLTNKIERLQSGSATVNVDKEIEREQKIIDNADEKIKGEVELIQTKITNTQKQIDDIQTNADNKIDIIRTDSKEQIKQLRTDAQAIIESEQIKLDKLDEAVSDVLNANKSFFNEEQEAAALKESQKPERNKIDVKINQTQKQLTKDIEVVNADTETQIGKIQTQADTQINELRSKIDGFNAEISTLQASIAEEVAQAKQRINDINSQAIVAGDNAENQIAEYELQINDAYDKIDNLNADKFVAESKIRDLEAEVGPIKYIAQFFDRDGDVDLERAVTWLIITIMFVFDPLAVLLLIAVNMSLKARYGWSFEDRSKSAMQTSKSSGSVKEKIVEKIVEVEADVDVSTPPSISKLEKKVEKKINKETKDGK
tara:strand:- start:121 stop:1596 length:1476 start_codon:yes stop_codon:yes gene_type:complete